MNDKELTKLAAKAFGVAAEGFSPLTDDGDALRLAVKLELIVDTNWYDSDACWLADKSIVCSFDSVEEEPHNDDPYAATRRAIVRAAAEVGRGMP